MKKLKITLQNLNQHPEKVIKSTQFLIIIGCVLILISAIKAILGETRSYGILEFWQDYHSNVGYPGQYSTEMQIAGYINLILVLFILILNFTMKSSPSKFGVYGLEFFILGILSLVFGNFSGFLIILIGIILLMIFQEEDEEEIINDKSEENYFFDLIYALKSYVIRNRISIIAVMFSFSGIIPLMDTVSFVILMAPFEILGLFLAKYEKRNNPNGLHVLAIFLIFCFCGIFIYHFLDFVGTPGRI